MFSFEKALVEVFTKMSGLEEYNFSKIELLNREI